MPSSHVEIKLVINPSRIREFKLLFKYLEGFEPSDLQMHDFFCFMASNMINSWSDETLKEKMLWYYGHAPHPKNLENLVDTSPKF